jgi:thiol-disulfide isomerase/thioredoxin
MRAIACALALALSPSAFALEAGAPLPGISVPRLEEPATTLSFASLKGSVVYVDFWASWCVPCRLSMPALDALYQQNRARGFAVVGVNKDVSAADARRFLAKVPVTFTLVSDAQDAAAKAFDVKAMPSGYLVDRKGIVRKVHRGFTAETAEVLTRDIETLLKEPS